jgi:DNA modification methylase
MILVLKNGTAPHINNVALGRFGRNRSNVWDYPGRNALNRTSKSKLSLHPTAKPVALVADAIRDCSNRGGLILDPFGGVGATLIAAEKTGRRARLIELDPRYVDAIVKRWETLTGGKAQGSIRLLYSALTKIVRPYRAEGNSGQNPRQPPGRSRVRAAACRYAASQA